MCASVVSLVVIGLSAGLVAMFFAVEALDADGGTGGGTGTRIDEALSANADRGGIPRTTQKNSGATDCIKDLLLHRQASV